tara:strand:- start:11824 stop:13314 length:1491 start_codon:yes stop_codon:yes gene_type:complete
MKTYLIRGVPLAMQHDGWWLNGAISPPRVPAQTSRQMPPGMGRLALLAGLILLGDLLVWQVLPGLSLAVFGAAMILAALWVARQRVTRQRASLVGGGAVLVLLPLVELVQPLSVLIAVAGLSVVLALLAGLRTGQLWRGALRLWPVGVGQGLRDLRGAVQGLDGRDTQTAVRRLMMGWLLPLALGAVFVALLLDANPIAQRWVDGLWQVDVRLPSVWRVVLWGVMAGIAWTALSVTGIVERLIRTPVPRAFGPAREGLVNAASVRRALVLFNGVFALQTAMDVMYLYGGVGLPEGISYAQYAHRGAYPLVVTALMAGGFAMVTRRWTDGDRMMRGQLMLWVAQNLALVVSALVRLDLYVGVYGLTHLRMAAAIWMVLVAVGLGLILWQLRQRHGNDWLVRRGGLLAAAVLYSCSWISFDATIARYNLGNPVQRDWGHLCWLGDAGQVVIAQAEAERGYKICQYRRDVDVPTDWREWGFRNWRARNSLSAIQAEATP